MCSLEGCPCCDLLIQKNAGREGEGEGEREREREREREGGGWGGVERLKESKTLYHVRLERVNRIEPESGVGVASQRSLSLHLCLLLLSGSSTNCPGAGWEKGPQDTCYQFNTDQRMIWAGKMTMKVMPRASNSAGVT